jgi:hypothetical protein
LIQSKLKIIKAAKMRGENTEGELIDSIEARRTMIQSDLRKVKDFHLEIYLKGRKE